jgi:hypothetical protein
MTPDSFQMFQGCILRPEGNLGKAGANFEEERTGQCKETSVCFDWEVTE